jgi:hypothetical protein
VLLIQAAIELQRRRQLHEADDGPFVGGVARDGVGRDRRRQRLGMRAGGNDEGKAGNEQTDDGYRFLITNAIS